MPPCVLLVDDDEFARGFACTVLERAGFAVRAVESVSGALAVVQSLQPCAVVTDWHLRDGDGGMLARQLHHEFVGLPIVLITGDTAGAEYTAMAGEFVTILNKPYSPSALITAVRATVHF
jgi:CheY-like chemotaxis protein